MAKELLTDELWEVIEPLLPEEATINEPDEESDEKSDE